MYLSTRRGAWVFPRTTDGGYPSDQFANRRIFSFVPQRILDSMGQRVANQRFDHRKFGLEPNYVTSQQHPMVNDDLPLRMMTGKLQIKPNIKLVKETSKFFTLGHVALFI